MNPLKLEDFNLKPEELTEIVTGAQKFLAPVADDEDDEQAAPTKS